VPGVGCPSARGRAAGQCAVAVAFCVRCRAATRGAARRDDFFLGLALEQFDELGAVDRLTLRQDLRHVVELGAMVLQHPGRRLMRLRDGQSDLLVLFGFVMSLE
jgi:hypothetical protein